MRVGALAMALLYGASICASGAFAQSVGGTSLPAKYESMPASTNIPGASYPRLFSDGRVTFQIRLPLAKKVQVEGGQGLGPGPFDMSKNADGVWSVTIPPTTVGFHYYWFNVDGVEINDPGSKTYFGYNKETSAIEVPDPFSVDTLLSDAPRPEFYDPDNVPQGEVREHWYFSHTTNKWRRCFVYTPPGYDAPANAQARYPILILQHGAGENETGWVSQGRVNFIMDSLINIGKAKPMIVVMDSGYATYGATSHDADSMDAATPYLFLPGINAFGAVVARDLIPMIDKTYRTIPDRDHRAMAGLSMGAIETLAVTLTHLDIFSSIGCFSLPTPGWRDAKNLHVHEVAGSLQAAGGIPIPDERPSPQRVNSSFDPMVAYGGAFVDAKHFNQEVHLLWFGAGTAEVPLNDALRANVDKLRAHGIQFVLYESPGTAHEWLTWRRDLFQFAPLLFR